MASVVLDTRCVTTAVMCTMSFAAVCVCSASLRTSSATHGEAFAGLPRARRFDGGIEREQVRLLGDAAHRFDEAIDVGRGRVQRLHLSRGRLNRIAHVGKDPEGAHDLHALLVCRARDSTGEHVHLLGAAQHAVGGVAH